MSAGGEEGWLAVETTHKGKRRKARGWLAWGLPTLIGAAVLISVTALVLGLKGLSDAACAGGRGPARAGSPGGGAPARCPPPRSPHVLRPRRVRRLRLLLRRSARRR